jgi:membrane-associated protein
MDFAFSAFSSWLGLHQNVAYIVLFFGTFFETLIGTCFFIPGELFLISGSVLAGAHVLSLPLVILALYGGAIAGDTTSFWIGHRIGPTLFKEGRPILSPENYRKGEALFAKYGTKAVFFARLLGPLSWITPFLAGVYKVPYKPFLIYNILGVLVGVGQFIIAGYFFGKHYQLFFWLVERYFVLIAAVALVVFLVLRYTRARRTT